MRRKIIAAFLVVLIPCLPVFAMDASIDSTKTDKQDKDESTSEKKTIDKKKSEGDKQSRTNSTGKDLTESKSLKDIETAMKSKSIDVNQSLEVIFIPLIADYEQAGIEPFASCKIAMRPKLPADFGLTAQISPNMIDSIKADWLNKAAASNSRLESGTEKGINEYKNCRAYYGLVVAQAYLNLADNLNFVGAQAIQEKGKDEGTRVTDLSFPDFNKLAEGAFAKAVVQVAAGKVSTDRAKTYKRVIADMPCYFNGAVEKINCGGSILTISAPPQLQYAGLHVFGQGFYGFQGTYKISSNYSYSDALEQLKSLSKYKKFVEDVSVYAEALRSKGMATEAVYVEKRAWESAKTGKVGISPAKFLPGSD